MRRAWARRGSSGSAHAAWIGLGAMSLAVAALSCTKIPDGDRALEPGDLPAVVRLRTDNAVCSGSLIAPRVVLTARHCLRPGADPPQALIAGAAPIRSIHARIWPGADLALLLLERDAPPGVTPLRLPRAGETASLHGREARLVGFGFARFSDDIGKHLAMARIVGDTDRSLLVRVQPERACLGDSGGPILVGDGDRAFVAAVTSIKMDIDDGKRCSGVASGARVVDYLPFIESFIAGTRNSSAALGDACYFDAHCQAGLACEALGDGVSARVCVGACGAANACPAGFVCAGAKCRPDAKAQPTGLGTRCAGDEGCTGGALCVGEPGSNERVCRARCYLGGPSRCATGSTCVADPARPARHVCGAGIAWVSSDRGDGSMGPWVYALAMIGFIIVVSIAARRGKGRGPKLRG